MKNANKRLLISIAALVISIALAATTTFAWFTMDTTPEVNDIDLSVTAQDGLYISGSGTAGDFFTNVTDTYEGTTVLKAITPTTATGNAFKKIQEGTTVTEEAAAATDYYKHTFYLRSQSDYDIYVESVEITGTANADRATIEAWKNLTAADLGVTGTWTAELEALYTDETTLTEGGTIVGTEILVQKGNVLPFQAAIANAIRVGFYVNSTMYTYKNSLGAVAGSWGASATTLNAAHDYYRTTTQMSPADITAFDTAWADPEYTVSTVGLSTGTKIADMTKNVTSDWYEVSVEVYVWADGTDKDCFNEILADGVSIDITFTGAYINV